MSAPEHSITPDPYELYERAAQSPHQQARFLRALHDSPRDQPLTLAEDFSAAGAISRAWLELDPASAAICVDNDPEPLQRLRALTPQDANLTIHLTDVLKVDDPADLIAVLNFSICERRTRTELIEYLRHAKSRLNPGGLFVCDIYGGADAYILGQSEEQLRDGVTYVWEQCEANPLTGEVVNAMHFVLPDGSRVEDAFVYQWRLWSLTELADACAEAGFPRIEWHNRLGAAIDDDGNLHTLPVTEPEELDDNYVVYLAARID